jgi:dipeptidase E
VVDLRPFLLEQDVIYVGGGNTANMLAIWRTHGVDRILREAWEQGIVLAGMEERRRPVYRQPVGSGFPPGYAIDDQVGLHFVDQDLAEVVSSVEGRFAYEVKLEGAAVRERPLTPRSLS